MANMASYPASDPCPGCMNGLCAHNYGMGIMYPPYYIQPDQMVCHPATGPYAGQNFVYGYGAEAHPMMYFPPPVPQLQHGYEHYHLQPSNGHYQNQQKRNKGHSKNKHNKNESNVQPPEEYTTSAVESALMFVKTNPEATLFSIDGLIAEVVLAYDGGLRFVQDRIQFGSEDEQCLALKATVASFRMLWKDYRGYRVIQALFTFGSYEMKQELMVKIHDEGAMNLLMHKHGCRVLQTAITSIDDEALTLLLSVFKGHIVTSIHDPNGNHVVQRIIEATSKRLKSFKANGNGELVSSLAAQLQLIIDDLTQNVHMLSVHSYGCRVIQRALEFCEEDQKEAVLKAIIECKDKLIEDQYGNYVLQQAIATGNEEIRGMIIEPILKGSQPELLLQLSKHKYASNVIEKLIEFGSLQQRENIINETLKACGDDLCIAVEMAKDNIANYVIKTAIEYAPLDMKKQIFDELSRNMIELSKYPQANYIFSRESGSVASA